MFKGTSKNRLLQFTPRPKARPDDSVGRGSLDAHLFPFRGRGEVPNKTVFRGTLNV